MCFGLTAMFVKMKIYFYCRNFAKKQIKINLQHYFLYKLQSIGRTQNILENVPSFRNGTQNQWTPPKDVPI